MEYIQELRKLAKDFIKKEGINMRQFASLCSLDQGNMFRFFKEQKRGLSFGSGLKVLKAMKMSFGDFEKHCDKEAENGRIE